MLDHIPGRYALLQGERLLYFGGTSYLGLATSAVFAEHLIVGIHRYGSNFGGSRLGHPRLRIFEEAEQWLAALVEAPAALTVSSGSLAGQLLAKYCATQGECYFAPGTHPALMGQGDAFEGSYEDWAAGLPEWLSQRPGPVYLFASTVDPIYARAYDFSWLHQLPAGRPLTLVLDDSHGIGVLGERGGGCYADLQAPPQVEVLCIASLAKAMGVPGGAVFGPQLLIDALWESPFFGGASPIPPPYLYAMLQAEDLYASARAKLGRLTAQLAAGLQAGESGLRSFPNYPVWYATEEALAPALLEQGILIPQFRYPTPDSPLATRIVLSAHHQSEDIEQLLAAIAFFEKTRHHEIL